MKSLENLKDKDPKTKLYMRDVITNISRILRYSTWDSAQDHLTKLPIKWDSYTVNGVLKTHPPMEKSWLFFNWAKRLKGFKHDHFTYTTMMDIFGEAGRVSSMKYVFKQMQELGLKVDAVTYTALLHWFSKNGDLEGALRIWEEMRIKGCFPTVVSYTAVMKILFDNDKAKEAAEVYKEMIREGCSPNCHTYTVLMEYLARAGKFSAALEILDKMHEAGVLPDKAMCNIFVQRCSQAGETWAIARVLRYMKKNSIVLRYPVYLKALEALRKAGESIDLLMETNPHVSFESVNGEDDMPGCGTGIGNPCYEMERGMILNLLARQDFISFEALFKGMMSMRTQFDSSLLSFVIQANCTNHRPAFALLAFKYGVETGTHIERSAYLSLVGFFLRNDSSAVVVEILEEMFRVRVYLGTYILTLLIYKLGCMRRSTTAENFFDALPDEQKNCVTYTALMGAYFYSGNVGKGLEIFDIMRRKGIHASPATYQLVIVALKKVGRDHEAESYRKELKSLQYDGHCNEILSFEESLCRILFDKGVVL
ncbi:hypothetical protein Scep_000794 [Stephania cephalantha]|uniref:Pentatricopeptide repeat-containing protein n=1 Tax=Stephania cephalantha TaxID=152367 RepID=A0AAP0L876_9MAGN